MARETPRAAGVGEGRESPDVTFEILLVEKDRASLNTSYYVSEEDLLGRNGYKNPAMDDALIRSRSNPFVRRLRALREKSRGELMLLEGPKLVAEALGSGVELVEAAASPRLAYGGRPGVVDALRGAGVTVRLIDDGILASVSEVETSQGILALARRPAFDEERIFAGTPLVLVAVGIQDPGNLGALLRSAEAAGGTGAYLTDGAADPFSWKALRGSMGSAFRLPHRRRLTTADALARLEAHGVRVVAADPRGTLPYDEADLRRPVAILLGSEGAGLAPAARSRAAASVAIPMARGVDSLNVSVAAGVLLFEAARQRRG
jgi:TrmH family RNA methyltransferase